MPQVLAWRANDGKLFEDVNKYRKYLKKLAVDRCFSKKVKRAQKQVEYLANEVLPNIKTFEELASIISNNWSSLNWTAVVSSKWHYNQLKKAFQKKKPYFPELISVEFNNVWYSDSIPNTHSCPKNGVTNWGRYETFSDGTPKPTGYPGAKGRMLITVDTSKADWVCYASDLFKKLGMNIGSGGSNRTSADYEVRLFAEDFPELWKTYKKEQLYKKLKS